MKDGPPPQASINAVVSAKYDDDECLEPGARVARSQA